MSYQYRSHRTSTASRHSYGNRPRPRTNRTPRGEYIDPSRFVKAAQPRETMVYEPKHSFKDFAIEPILLNNLTQRGYSVPSPIQDQAIPDALEGHDIIGIASTGTGKTAAFAIPLIQKLISDPRSSAIVIAPTRELAQQIEDECRKLAQGCRLYSTLLIGGTGMGRQLQDLRQRPRIVIGTPGRIKDHLQRGTLKLHDFNVIVLDEVDRMLDMGFVHDVRSILSQANATRQSFFFSATIDNRVRTLIETFTKNPKTISIKPSSSSENVHQDVVRYQTSADKIDKLHNVLAQEKVSKVIVFDETQRGVERLSKELVSRGFVAESIHGGKSQGQRQRALTKFKKSEITILVATDVAARGIDVADISHVVNYSIPKAYDDYIHRIGRTGRAGQVGYALTFVAQ